MNRSPKSFIKQVSFCFPPAPLWASIHMRLAVCRWVKGVRQYDAEKIGVVGLVVALYRSISTGYGAATTLRQQILISLHVCARACVHMEICVSYRRTVVLISYLIEKNKELLRQALRHLLRHCRSLDGRGFPFGVKHLKNNKILGGYCYGA